ncbi:MAG: GntR family transcriptional regulator [Oscillospiraceae bacterium]|nr:GntR family transcriptional regulator [Oscillospiraceae bacterium]
MNESQPVYQRIIEVIENDIIARVYDADGLIISTNQIAKLYSVNPSTAMKAIAQMTEDGTIYKRPGIGMCVSRGARDRLIESRRAEFFGPALDALYSRARTLGVTVEEIAQSLREREASHD